MRTEATAGDGMRSARLYISSQVSGLARLIELAAQHLQLRVLGIAAGQPGQLELRVTLAAVRQGHAHERPREVRVVRPEPGLAGTVRGLEPVAQLAERRLGLTALEVGLGRELELRRAPATGGLDRTERDARRQEDRHHRSDLERPLRTCTSARTVGLVSS